MGDMCVKCASCVITAANVNDLIAQKNIRDARSLSVINFDSKAHMR